jgi:hypothetical protein
VIFLFISRSFAVSKTLSGQNIVINCKSYMVR